MMTTFVSPVNGFAREDDVKKKNCRKSSVAQTLASLEPLRGSTGGSFRSRQSVRLAARTYGDGLY